MNSIAPLPAPLSHTASPTLCRRLVNRNRLIDVLSHYSNLVGDLQHSEFRGHHTDFHICDGARRDKFELGSNIALVEAVDQATDHPGDDFEPLLESKRCGVFDEGAAPRDLQ